MGEGQRGGGVGCCCCCRRAASCAGVWLACVCCHCHRRLRHCGCWLGLLVGVVERGRLGLGPAVQKAAGPWCGQQGRAEECVLAGLICRANPYCATRPRLSPPLSPAAASLQLRDSAKRRLQERQQAQQGDEGPLAARQQLLERLRAKKVLDAELKEADQKLAGGPAARGRDPQPGLEDEMNAAVRAGGGAGREAACGRASPQHAPGQAADFWGPAALRVLTDSPLRAHLPAPLYLCMRTRHTLNVHVHVCCVPACLLCAAGGDHSQAGRDTGPGHGGRRPRAQGCGAGGGAGGAGGGGGGAAAAGRHGRAGGAAAAAAEGEPRHRHAGQCPAPGIPRACCCCRGYCCAGRAGDGQPGGARASPGACRLAPLARMPCLCRSSTPAGPASHTHHHHRHPRHTLPPAPLPPS